MNKTGQLNNQLGGFFVFADFSFLGSKYAFE